MPAASQAGAPHRQSESPAARLGLGWVVPAQGHGGPCTGFCCPSPTCPVLPLGHTNPVPRPGSWPPAPAGLSAGWGHREQLSVPDCSVACFSSRTGRPPGHRCHLLYTRFPVHSCLQDIGLRASFCLQTYFILFLDRVFLGKYVLWIVVVRNNFTI